MLTPRRKEAFSKPCSSSLANAIVTIMSVKKLKIEYGDSVFSLPRKQLMEALGKASGFDLKVLIHLASDDELRLNAEKATEDLCRRLDCTPSAFMKSVGFWNGFGVLTPCESDDIPHSSSLSSPGPAKKTLQSSDFPVYSESRAADVIENHTELAGIMDACQQIVGRIFTPNEVQSVVAIYDYLGLCDDGYIVTLYQFCKKNGKTSPRYIEKTAISLFDQGIVSTSLLNDYIKKKEDLDDMTSKVRSLIGAVSRKLTPKETKCIECWCDEWGFSFDVISRAYEVTVDKIGEYKMPYMNRVLENWHNAGLVTIEDVDASLESYQKKKSEPSASEDFEVNEYFEAALERSRRYMEEMKKEDDGG